MTATSVEPKIGDGVLELVRQHDCESELWGHLELVRECFPDLREVTVRLLHDPDEDGHIRVMLSPHIPTPVSLVGVMEAKNRFLEMKADRFPDRFHPGFSLIITYLAR